MPARAKSICRKTGCNTLINTPGYCELHAKESSPFKELDKRKTPETTRFYRSWAWTKTSRLFRKNNQLCEECIKPTITNPQGIVKKSEMVHHEPPLEELLKENLNPHDEQYLHALCNNCHLKELREKKH
jgi:5-methylcytosine-specific restriction protein A